MTIENPDSVDGMGISKSDGKVVLTISDHVEWSDEKKHFNLIEKKINAYLDFIRGGQMLEALPNSKGREIRIEIIYQHHPSDIGGRFLMAAKRQLWAEGVDLVYKALSDKY
jgi:hypothetical protein